MKPKQFVVLRGLTIQNVFYTAVVKGKDPTHNLLGDVHYEVLSYHDIEDEARKTSAKIRAGVSKHYAKGK